MDRQHEEHGASSRQLVLVFLASVAVCAVFFSLGFLVGYNERSPANATPTEAVAGSSSVPPPVNQPQAGSPGSSAPSPTAESSLGAASTSALARGATSQPASAAEPITPTPLKPRGRSPAERKAKTAAIPSESSLSAGQPAVSGISVQVMASRTQADAERLASMLVARGYPAKVFAPSALNAGDNLYRVEVGPYNTRAAAEQVRDKLAGEGFKPFIRH
jgi:DedD protein